MSENTGATDEIPTPYEDLLVEIMDTGNERGDRTGTGTKSLFGKQVRYDLSEGYPLLTTKKVYFKKMATELVWFLRGDTNIRYLLERDVHFWSEWAYKEYLLSTDQAVPESSSDEWKQGMREFEQRIVADGEFAATYGNLGQVYGAQWRKWQTTTGETIDQIEDVINEIKTSPESRRLVVTAWNPEFVPTSALPPCHVLFQFYVANGRLSCHLYQRSADMFLGVPFNIASYALLTMMIAQQTDLEPGELVMTFGDGHIYSNHFDQVRQQLGNEPRPYPTLRFARKPESISDYDVSDFIVENYESHEHISAPIAV
ncbi:thymidylate synthase [Candidatus Saccharibacteria bacterium TM7i]|nr:thymidylate synthase [Candidatus Saccharibacteria bacterium TM7i]